MEHGAVPPVVGFPVHVGLVAVEQRLSQFYGPSLKGEHPVLFDLGSTEWIEPYSLSILVLWIQELQAQGIRVKCRLPTTTQEQSELAARSLARFRRFIGQKGLVKFLYQCNAIDGAEAAAFDEAGAPLRVEGRLTPIVFLNRYSDFKQLMAGISDQDQYRLDLGSAWDVPIVSQGELRDIVLRELGDNLFDHADGRFGHLHVSTRRALELSRPTDRGLLNARVANAPAFQRQFFSRLGERGYLTIIVADKGPGIPKTLRRAYGTDQGVGLKTKRPGQAELVDYAFLQHSSRKTLQQRLGDIEQILRSLDQEDLPPATGLHWVREVVREYRGLLTVRSDRTIVAYDYLSYPHSGRPSSGLLTNKRDDGLSHVAPFQGTIIEIAVPYALPAASSSRPVFLPTAAPAEPSAHGYYEYIHLAPPPSPAVTDVVTRSRDWLVTQITNINTLVARAQPNTTVVLDCDEWEAATGPTLKALSVLLVHLMRAQSPDGVRLVTIGASATVERLAMTIPVVIAGSVCKERALAAIDFGANVSVWGGPASSAPDSLTPRRSGQLRHLDHLIRIDDEGRTDWTFDPARVRQVAQEALAKRIAEVIENEGIHRREGCYLLPSGAYSEGYFDIHRLLGQPTWRRLCIRWLLSHLPRLKACTLVAIGQNACVLAEDVQSHLADDSVVHLVPDARNERLLVRLALFDRDRPLVLVTDVVGTQRSLAKILSYAGIRPELTVLSIVDARRADAGEERPVLPLRCVLRHPLKYWLEDKPPHFLYEEITRVDPLTNSPIDEQLRAEEPIWRKQADGSLSSSPVPEVLASTGALHTGHFEVGERHMTVLVRTPSVVSEYRDEIVSLIVSDFQSYVGRDPQRQQVPVTHLVFPADAYAVAELGRLIASAVAPSCLLVPIPRDMIARPHAYPGFEGDARRVIVLDDALGSGITARLLIDTAERSHADEVFFYALINRADALTTRLLQLIQRYGHSAVHTRFLLGLPVPTFPLHDCPTCKYLDRLAQLLREWSAFPTLAELAMHESSRWSVIRLTRADLAVQGLGIPAADERPARQVDIRVRLDRAKTQLRERHDLAELARDWRRRPDDVLRLFRAICGEEEYFRRDPVTFTEVFYPALRAAIVEAATSLLTPQSDYRNLSVCWAMLRVFSPSTLIKSLQLHSKSEAHIGTAAPHLALCAELRGTPRSTRDALVSAMKESGSPVLKELVGWAETLSGIGRTDQVFRSYKRIFARLNDSTDLPNLLQGSLRAESFDILSMAEATDLLQTFWPGTHRLLEDSILPELDTIGESDIARAVCRAIRDHASAVRAQIGAITSVVATLADAAETPYARSQAQQLVADALLRLFSHLLSPTTSVKTELQSLQVDVGRVVRAALDHRRGKLEELGAAIECSIPTRVPPAFGHAEPLFIVVNNLLENVVEHAFSQAITTRRVVVAVNHEAGSGIVEVSVSDSGTGFRDDVELGRGLTTIEEHVGPLGAEWGIAPANGDNQSTRAWVRLHSVGDLQYE